MKRKLDRTDQQILQILQNNARISNKELAAQVHLAPSTCLERVKKLEKDGILKNFHAEIDPRALGADLEVLAMVQLTQSTQSCIHSFYEHIQTIPEVIRSYHISGEYDFLLHILTSNTDALRHLLVHQFSSRSEVHKIQTLLIFNCVHKPILVGNYQGDEQEGC